MSTLLEQIHATSRKHRLWGNGDRIVVGLSGGPDSVALVRLLNAETADEGLSLACAHVNYGLRAEADMDQAFCAQLCGELNLHLHVLNRPRQSGTSNVQAWARQVRYQWFGELCELHGYSRVAVGHTLGDRAETFMLQLFRGAHRGGAANMQPRSGAVIRPLLYTRRSDLEHYLSELGQAYRSDSTNDEPSYRRNRVRNELMPLLSDIFTRDAESTLALQADLYELEDDYLRQQASSLLDAVEVRNQWRRIPLAVLRDVHPALQLQLFKKLTTELGGALRQGPLLDLVHLVNLTPGKRAQVADGYTAERGRDHIWIFRPASLPDALDVKLSGDTRLPDGTVLHAHPAEPTPPFPDGRLSVRVSVPASVGPLQLRLALQGDRIQPFGMSGTRLVYDVLAEAGVPRFMRERTWILADPDTVYWLPGIRPAEAVRVHPGDSRVYEFAWDAEEESKRA
jgi:tRNA(Ile)-lysidine synthase